MGAFILFNNTQFRGFEEIVSVKNRYVLPFNESSRIINSFKLTARRKSPTPDLPKIVYNGKTQIPVLPENDIYSISSSSGVNAGVYPIVFELYDCENYEFSDTSGQITHHYEILPIALEILVHDVDKYLFSKPGRPTYEIISGELLEGDTLNLVYLYEDDRVVCICENSNYTVSFDGGIIKKHNYLSKDGIFYLFLFLLILATMILLTVILIKRRCEIADYFARLKCKTTTMEEQSVITKQAETIQAEQVEQENTADTEDDGINIDLSVDAAHADNLITDNLAKDLVRKEGVKIYTYGSKKGIINVDTLSENFISGETVDVNKLKEMSLVPYDTAYIKVLARGMIDKPLKVYANDFSLSAVKMLALTGGEAIRVITVRKKYSIDVKGKDKIDENS